jgi:RNA polymerase sigma-70 factor (ECF subfamily)
MERYASGDDAAFEDLYDELAPRLHRYFLRQTRDVDLADDLVQQTLIKIHRARGQFLSGAAVVPWAFAIGRRILLDHLRQRRRRHEAPTSDGEPPEEAAKDPAADALVEAQETARRIQAALLRLPESQRVAFELVKQEGLSFAEAAEVLGTTVSAVKLRAHRAYQALRIVLGDLLPAEGGQAL